MLPLIYGHWFRKLREVIVTQLVFLCVLVKQFAKCELFCTPLSTYSLSLFLYSRNLNGKKSRICIGLVFVKLFSWVGWTYIPITCLILWRVDKQHNSLKQVAAYTCVKVYTLTKRMSEWAWANMDGYTYNRFWQCHFSPKVSKNLCQIITPKIFSKESERVDWG